MRLQIGQEIDGYRIEKVIGQGGMGVVYRAEDVELSKKVALKVIVPSMSEDDQFVHRFRSEARSLAKVVSPHIVAIHALRRTTHGFFIVMEYVEGGDLSDLVANGSIGMSKALSIFKQLLCAIRDAHGAGVIHRDIKPQNIMITDAGNVKVTDFGLAKIISTDSTKSITGGVMGSLHYMSPEQVRAENVDSRSDIWALGVVLYEMLTGRRPFDADREASILYNILQHSVERDAVTAQEIPPELWRAIERALEKDPDRRYQDVSEMLRDIEAIEYQLLQKERTGESDENTLASTLLDSPTKRLVNGAAAESGNGHRQIIIGGGSAALLVVAAVSVILITSKGDNPHRPSISTISIETDPPGAVVFISGDTVGKTPLWSHELSETLDSVQVSMSLEGYSSVDTTLSTNVHNVISLHREETEPPDPEPGPEKPPSEQWATIELRSESFASIFLDGHRVSTSAPKITPEEPHRVLFRSPDYGDVETTINLDPGESRELTAWFTAKLNVTSGSINSASVILNGTEINEETPVVEKELTVGEYSIQLEKVGYRAHPADTTIIVAPRIGQQEVVRIRFTLVPE